MQTMRKEVVLIALTIFLIPGVATALQPSEEGQIQTELQLFERAVNTGNLQQLRPIISNVDADLYENITRQAQQNISYEILATSIKEEESSVRVDVTYSATKENWKISGFPGYYEFENVQGQWKMVDTSFPQDVTKQAYTSILAATPIFTILIVTIIIIAISSAFWLWMIVDCLKKEQDNKELWLLLLVVGGSLAAMAYFLLVKVSSDELSNEAGED